MASARARLGAARRGIIGRQKKTDVLSGILGTAGTVAAFAGTQAKKAKTAWGEYEAGYKALGGDVTDIDKGGWFNRTFKGPGEGEVEIGKKMYDRKAIQKTGGILGSDTGALLSEDTRKEYIARQGRDMTAAELRARSTTFGVSDPNLVTSEFASSRTGVYDPTGGVGVSGRTGGGGVGFNVSDSTANYRTQQSNIISNKLSQSEDIMSRSSQNLRQDLINTNISKRTFRGGGGQSTSEAQTQAMMSSLTPGLEKESFLANQPTLENYDLQQIQKVPEQEMNQSFLQKMGQGIKQKFSDIGVQKWQQSERERIEAEKQRIWGPSYKERKSAWETSRGQ